MRIGAFFFGGVEMTDAGAGPPAATDRRYSQDVFADAQASMLDLGVAADRLGYDAFWLTEHLFQHEGYEVVPNAILFGAFLAERTRRIRIGALFNIVPQWHPLRLAEDFAMLHNLSGGRAILGVGRGTVPREAEALGTVIGSFDNPDKAQADRINREVTDEAMAVIRLALDNERFVPRPPFRSASGARNPRSTGCWRRAGGRSPTRKRASSMTTAMRWRWGSWARSCCGAGSWPGTGAGRRRRRRRCAAVGSTRATWGSWTARASSICRAAAANG